MITPTTIKPPQWPLRLLRLFIKKEYMEEIEGDMEELYQDDIEQFSKKKANRKYVLEVIKLLRPTLTRKLEGSQKLNTYGMLKNNLRIAFRNLIKQKEYSAINILGLTVSMALSMLIIVFLIDQDSMDEHNPDANRIYRVLTEYIEQPRDRVASMGTSPFELDQLISFNLDQAVDHSQITQEAGNIQFDERIFRYSGLYVSPNFLDFFHFDLVKGNAANALAKSNSVVLSSELAQKLFSDKDPIDQLVTINDLGSFSVAGVIDTKKVKSHISYDLLLPIQTFESNPENEVFLTNWEAGSKRIYNYVKLENDTPPEVLTTYLTELDSKFPEEKEGHYWFTPQRLDEINLGKLLKNEIGITTPFFVTYFFLILVMVLMLSASFNYMNLSIARGLKRAKEVGVRKIIGAGKRQIIWQFLVEAQLVMFASFVLAFVLLQALVPLFNDLKILRDIGGGITMNFNTNMQVYLVFLAFTVIVGIISGAYPALYLSSFKSLEILKGSNSSGKSPSFFFRKVLVFIQYSFSVIFMITTVIQYKQAVIIAETEYGFSHENIVNVPMTNIPYESFRNELLTRSEIQGVSAISNLPAISSLSR